MAKRNPFHSALIGPNTQETIDGRGFEGARKLLADEKQRATYGIARLVRLALVRLSFIFPFTLFIDDIFKREGRASVAIVREVFYVLRFGFVCWLLSCTTPVHVLLIFLLVYLELDVLQKLFGQAFVWGDKAIDPFRSLLLTLMNYAEMVVAFAVLYRYFEPARSSSAALYFSFVAGTTMGTVEEMPTDGWVKFIAACQFFVFAMFTLIIIGTMLGRVPAKAEPTCHHHEHHHHQRPKEKRKR